MTVDRFERLVRRATRIQLFPPGRSRLGKSVRTRQDFTDRCPVSGLATPVCQMRRSGFTARSIAFVRNRHAAASALHAGRRAFRRRRVSGPWSRRCMARARVREGRSRAVSSSRRAASADRGNGGTRIPSDRFGRRRTSGFSRNLLRCFAYPWSLPARTSWCSRRDERIGPTACARRPPSLSRYACEVAFGTVRARSRRSSVRRRTR